MAFKLFPVLYIGFQNRDNDEVPLGFMTQYEKGSPFKNRKETVDEWAYGRGSHGKSDKKIQYPPKFMANELIDGFKIGDHLTRGDRNKSEVWRVRDPRGFELEINCNNLKHVIANSAIENGLIKKKCVWAKDKARNFLAIEGTEEYNSAVNFKSAMVNAISKKDIKPGMNLTLRTGETVLYLGSYYLFKSDANYDKDTKYELSWSKKKLYCYKVTDTTASWRRRKSPEIKAVTNMNNVGLQSTEKFWDEEEINQLIQGGMTVYNGQDYDISVSAVASKKSNVEKYELRPVTKVIGKTLIVEGHPNGTQDRIFVLDTYDIDSLNKNNPHNEIPVIRSELFTGVRWQDPNERTPGSGLGYHPPYRYPDMKRYAITKNLKFSELWVKLENGQEFKVVDFS